MATATSRAGNFRTRCVFCDLISHQSIIIVCNDERKISVAESLRGQLAGNGESIVCYRDADVEQLDGDTVALVFDQCGTYLQQCGRKAPGPVWADFVGGSLGYRRRQAGSGSGLLAKAIGIGGGMRPRVLDVTAGLGQDAFVMASLGCRVTAVERHPLVFALLADGIARAELAADSDRQLRSILDTLSIVHQDSVQLLRDADDLWQPDVIFLDPMFPPRNKSARVNKVMQLFQRVVGQDDADELFHVALAAARYRLVVKRPRLAEPLAGEKPLLQFSGKAVRFDIYPKRKMEKNLD